jgi:magnesium-dependent phosphatase 1
MTIRLLLFILISSIGCLLSKIHGFILRVPPPPRQQLTKATAIPITKYSFNSHHHHHVKHCSYSTPSSTALNAKKNKISNDKKKKKSNKKHNKKTPKLIIFDLDGCLWSPEMYEIMYYMGGKGSPFTIDDDDPNILRTAGGNPVTLLGHVRSVFHELQYDEKWWNTKIGISSRTDEPNWARELLQKFIIDEGKKEKDEYPPFPMNQVFTSEICELAHDSKVLHFERIIENAPGRPKFQDCLFFDNELGNCLQVAKLGVTVCYCPRGVTKDDWDTAISNFPCSNGKVIGK